MRNTPERSHEEPQTGYGISGIRMAAMAAVLTLIAACDISTKRSGGHIDITDPRANATLETLRQQFEHDTTRVRYSSTEELLSAVAPLLRQRDELLEAQGIRKGTEKWRTATDINETMQIEVDETACQAAPTCRVMPPGSPFPKLKED